MRRRQRRGLAKALKKLHVRVAKGRLKKRDKILEAVGRLKERFPKAHRLRRPSRVSDTRANSATAWNVAKFKDALARDGAYLLRSNQAGWSAQEFWETYIQLTVVERAFRVLKSQLLLRPIWHQYSGRTQAHVFICVLAYALWKTLDHLAKRAGLMTLIHKPDPRRGNAVAQTAAHDARGDPARTGQIQIGDIQLETTDRPEAGPASRRSAQRRAETHPGRPGPGTARTLESRPPFVVKTAASKTQNSQCF